MLTAVLAASSPSRAGAATPGAGVGRRRWLAALVALVPRLPGGSLLEIGAGGLIGSVCEPGTAAASRVCCWDGSDAGKEGISGNAYWGSRAESIASDRGAGLKT
jgi:hypothetical protein